MKKTSLTAMTIGALGIVYGDIGTSPLYAMNEVFFGNGKLSVTPEHAAGVASLIFWMLLLVVGVKYASFILRADHRNEGGVFALLGLLHQSQSRNIMPFVFLLMFSAGLLFGDGIITPAISVLSAVEGLNVAAPALERWVVPITLITLVGIFFFQKQGTRRVGKIYGPIVLLWFVSIGALGAWHLAAVPWIIPTILNPLTALGLLWSVKGVHLMYLIGAVFLAITGSEALYADMGHFGKRAIRIGWFGVVFPSLVLNYAGQGAYLLSGQPVHGGNLFYSLVPEGLLLPMILLATAATVIASVSLIFGAYSLVSQAIVLNILPRFRVVHTNEETEGQIYIPAINWLLFSGSASLVLLFGSATRLAAAYGFAVSGVMLITSIVMMTVSRQQWRWKKISALAVFGTFFVIDLGFVASNSVKFFEGGYIPFLLGCSIFGIIVTWRWGRQLLRTAYDSYVSGRDIRWFLNLKRRVEANGGILRDERVRYMVETDRAAVFLISRAITGPASRIPVKLRVYLKRRGTIPKNMILLNIEQERVPFLRHHYEVTDLGQNVYAVHARFGFMENPDATRVLHDLYRQSVFEKKFRRCTIEASEDEFIIDQDLPWLERLRAEFLKRLMRFSVPRYRYFGLNDEAAAGLSKTVVPIHLSREGVRVDIPEFPLKGNEDRIDPDTLEPTTIRYASLKRE